jgi:hypothetical protein
MLSMVIRLRRLMIAVLAMSAILFSWTGLASAHTPPRAYPAAHHYRHHGGPPPWAARWHKHERKHWKHNHWHWHRHG